MKTIITAIVATLFTAGVSAADVYYGLEKGNPDLSTQPASGEGFVGVQPSVGESIDRYHGWADGNPDLFKSDRSGPMQSGDDPRIYAGFGANPDLHF